MSKSMYPVIILCILLFFLFLILSDTLPRNLEHLPSLILMLQNICKPFPVSLFTKLHLILTWYCLFATFFPQSCSFSRLVSQVFGFYSQCYCPLTFHLVGILHKPQIWSVAYRNAAAVVLYKFLSPFLFYAFNSDYMNLQIVSRSFTFFIFRLQRNICISLSWSCFHSSLVLNSANAIVSISSVWYEINLVCVFSWLVNNQVASQFPDVAAANC